MKKAFSSPSLESRFVIALLAIHVVLAISSMHHASLTWDEPSYIGVGRQLIETRNPQIVALQLHPPLSYYINSLLLLPLKIEPDLFADPNYVYREYIGLPLVFESGYEPGLVALLARIPFVFLSALLGLVVWRWCRSIYGGGAAVFAVFLYSLSPLVLANCRLATPDIVLALTVTLALYCFTRYLQRPSHGLLVLTGGALGFSFLSKFTGLILIPTFLFVVLVHWLWSESGPTRFKALGGYLSRLSLIFGIAFLVVWAGYGFQFGIPFMPEWLKPEANRLTAEKPFWQAVDALAKRGIRVPAYSYLLGIYTQFAAARGWKDNFLFGQISQTGWWYFYWAAFVIKSSLPFIICLGAAAAMRRDPETKGKERLLLASMAPMIVFFSLPTKINIGIRYILPLVPLLIIFSAKVARIRLPKWKPIFALLCVWYAAATIWIHPHYLAYFNELVGGPGNGYKYLVDSNLDWGQSLGELANYLKENKIKDAKIQYFGPPGVMKYYGLKNVGADEYRPSPGIWAVSATYLQNLYLLDRHRNDWLMKLEPKKVIGYSIFVYDVSEKDAGLQAR